MKARTDVTYGRGKKKNSLVGRKRGEEKQGENTTRYWFVTGCDASYEMQGPSFVSEPPSRVEFTNVNGGRVDCIVRGNPAPTVDWLAADGGSITSIPGIRHVLGNGTIHFPGFEAEVFRQDVHWAIYKCSAVNSVGAIVSRDVTVRAGTRNFSLVIRITPPAFLLHSSCKQPVSTLPSLDPVRPPPPSFLSFFSKTKKREEIEIPFSMEKFHRLFREDSRRYFDISRFLLGEDYLVWGILKFDGR